MTRSIEGERLFFRTGPLILAVWGFLIIQGYKAVWTSVLGSMPPTLITSLATVTAFSLYILARFFEEILSDCLVTPNFTKATLTSFVGIVLLVLSGLGVANALYVTISGGTVIEGDVRRISASYDALITETEAITHTPALDNMNQRLKGPVDLLMAEIVSPNCGIGSGALQALVTIRREIGPTFIPLNFAHRTPSCTDTATLQQMATQYRDYIHHQVESLSSVMEEHTSEKRDLVNFIDIEHREFSKKASEALIAANDAARAAQFFGSRDGFEEPIHRLVALDQMFLDSRSQASERARRFGASYSQQVLGPVNIDQGKGLGSLQSLFTALIRPNPLYMPLLGIAALGLDALLIFWFRQARKVVFLDQTAKLIGVAGDRVRNLWLPPENKRKVRQ